ncbi:MAG: 50S ribosomal protein L16 [Candidatus Nanoarchaeia archaeon]|nr:50S ribosomal protein L16 [Candidatus Nanoarchaeia archaeon]
MAKLRKFVGYRTIERPYTRKSRFRALNFVRASPPTKVVKFDLGDTKRKFEYELSLISDCDLQIRDNSLEAARKMANRHLEKNFGRLGYHLQVSKYPHHFLRENATASGAGADRLSTGMKMSFGKVIGRAAQVRKGETIFRVHVDQAQVELSRKILGRISTKMPRGAKVVVKKITA